MTVLLSNQQKFLLEALETLGGANLRQLTELLRPVFCAKKPEAAPRIVDAAMRQMRCCNVQLCQNGDLFYFPSRCPSQQQLEAVDVMLELSSVGMLSYRSGKPPILLRFSVQEDKKIRQFTVTTPGADVYGIEFYQAERIILLFDGQGTPHILPVSNKQFLAVRQIDGTHRFYTVDGQTQRR